MFKTIKQKVKFDAPFDFAIVGAGITGLDLGWKFNQFNTNLKVVLLEKSKSCGGRLATRRIGESKYDHGAQFIKYSTITENLISFFQYKNVLQKFPSVDFNAYSGNGGMTKIAKALAEDLQVIYNFKVLKISKKDNGWCLSTEDGQQIFSHQIIITCPLPQSLDLLRSCSIDFAPELSDLTFAKAIVSLVQFESDLNLSLNYFENYDENIFSITSQKAKGLATAFTYSFAMSEKWSEENFSKSDEEILTNTRQLLNSKFETNTIFNIDIKKWRFSHPKNIWKNTFYSPQPGLFLAGDAFGGPSLTGAIKSADGLFDFIKPSLEKTKLEV